MAGSFEHVVNRNLEFQGCELLDHLGDAYEALEEMYHMLMWFSGGDKEKLKEAYIEGYFKKHCPIENLESARKHFLNDDYV